MKSTINFCIYALLIACVYGDGIKDKNKHLCMKACSKDYTADQLTSQFCYKNCPAYKKTHPLDLIAKYEKRRHKIQEICKITCKSTQNSGKHTKEFCKDFC